MTQLAAVLASHDEEFRRQMTRLLRSDGVRVAVLEDTRGGLEPAAPDVAIVDIRGDMASGVTAIERVRVKTPNAAIFAIAAVNDPDLILQAMRAGANEFFVWPPPVDALQGALRRTAARRESAQAATRPPSVTLVFFGAKGGAGTTTVAVNCAVELARLSKRPTIAVDLKPGLGEVALFLGVRPRFTILDVIDNLHRLDRDFLRELVARHKSGLEILAGSEQFDRPGPSDASAIEEMFRILTSTHDFIVVDGGNAISACALAALYAADTTFVVTNPDVPSVRNAQRLVERVRQLGAGAERIRVLLNRASEPLMITPKQIEAALGQSVHHTFSSDYKTVSTALNSGIPLSQTNHSEISEQFSSFTRGILGPSADEPAKPERRAGFLGLLT